MKKLFTILLFTLLANVLTAQISKTIDVTTPGSLSTLLTTEEKTTVTDLTLTGNIDARDVKCMRDEMTVLANIDISVVSIMEYTGADGTVSQTTTYPANEMPQYSFYQHSKLKSIQLPNKIISIGDYAFFYCLRLKSIVIPNNVTLINLFAFSECYNLTDVTLGSSVSTIGSSAFAYCSSLKTITSLNTTPPSLHVTSFENIVTSPINFVFASAVNAYKAAADWSVFTIASMETITIHVPTAGGLAAALIAAGHTPLSSIGSLTVTGNLNSTDFTQLKNNLTSLVELDLSGVMVAGNALPASAFEKKYFLKSVKLPASLETIGDRAFADCTYLSSALPLPSGLISIGNGAFYSCNSMTGNLNFPNSLKSIGNSAFYGCGSLTGNLSIPNSVTSIGGYAFTYCQGFTGTLTLPNTITTIKDETFYLCSGLSGEVIFPLSIISVYNSAFTDCSKLTELTFSKSINRIGENAFKGCSGLIKISMPRTVPPTIFASTFAGVNIETCTVHVPIGTTSTYQSDPNWGLFVLYNETGVAETYSITVNLGPNGSIKENNVSLSNGSLLTVTPGSTKTFTIIPANGYEIASLIYNGMDVKSQIVNNQFTTPEINANATLSVTFQKNQYRLSLKDASSGTINLLCEYGATPSFDFTAEPNWKVNTILYNDVDVTNNLVNGIYTVPAITANGLLNVSFVSTLTGAPELLNNRIKVYSSNSEIIVEGAASGETVSLYTLNGTHLQTMKSQGEKFSIPARKDAVYIVKTDAKTFKVMM